MNGKMPLVHALQNHKNRVKWSFHVPGHKNGRVSSPSIREFFEQLFSYDFTELTGLDDLHQPEGAIHEAQQLTAQLYGAQNSFFLVGGSTSGNLAMIMSAFQPGDLVLVQRNSHKSILHGLELAGVEPIFLEPEIHEIGEFPLSLPFRCIEEALRNFPDAKGIILTNPNYYGMTADIAPVVRLMHSKGLPVLVDEAHGAHFTLEGFPVSAVSTGADVVVQSAHKTLPALTMGAFLHYSSQLVDLQKIAHSLQMIQSSSPSYPIMASLDAARNYLEEIGETEIRIVKDQCAWLKECFETTGAFIVIEAADRYEADPLKVTIQAKRELTGYELQHLFELEGIFLELADHKNVLFVLPLGEIPDKRELKDAICRVAEKVRRKAPRLNRKMTHYSRPISRLALPYKDMGKRQTARIPLLKAEGCIAAEAIIPYPPGIPLVARGENITRESIKAYQYLAETGVRFQGVNEASITIFDDEEIEGEQK